MPAGRLGPDERRAAVGRMRRDEFDLVVVGGGVTGSGAALDAASRGLSVALVEARDLAAGTSSRSSKLIHGGLRYLEQRNFALVREALHERSLLLRRLAPHLVTPVPFVLPLTHRVWQRGYYGAGVLLYDLMGGARAVPRHRHLSRTAALQLVPSLRRDALIGAIEYHDAQVDDARHTLTVARTAASLGALVTTSTRVTEVLRERGRVTGVRVRDLESGEEFDVRARAVVNATGVWTDEMQEMVGGGTLKVRASKGIHVVVPRSRIDASTGLILRTAVSVLFVIPWGAHWIVGTTDTDWNLDKAHPAASRRDIDYLLGEVNKVLHDPLTHDDIEGVYAGLRPLLTGESESTSRLSREHAVITPVPGLVVVAGGKYTTYRVMAKDAVDAAAAWLGRPVARSRTEHVPLLGARGFRALWTRRADLARRLGIDQPLADRLLRRYGSLVPDLVDLVDARPELGRPLEGAPDHLAAEVVYAASHEAALHLDDVLTRRTRTSIEVVDRGLGAAEPAARLMAGVLGWDEETVAREVEHYAARVAAERESQTRPDDETADAARLGAPDVRAAGRLPVRAPLR